MRHAFVMTGDISKASTLIAQAHSVLRPCDVISLKVYCGTVTRCLNARCTRSECLACLSTSALWHGSSGVLRSLRVRDCGGSPTWRALVDARCGSERARHVANQLACGGAHSAGTACDPHSACTLGSSANACTGAYVVSTTLLRSPSDPGTVTARSPVAKLDLKLHGALVLNSSIPACDSSLCSEVCLLAYGVWLWTLVSSNCSLQSVYMQVWHRCDRFFSSHLLNGATV